jgi:type IV pilus assembly protein PilW
MTPNRKLGRRVHRHPEAGFTLVEVMAALVILSIALTAVFATFMSQQKSFIVQSRVAEMQQNLRQAVEYMSRDIRMAGYGIPDNVTIPNNIIAAGITSIRSLYAKDNTTGPDQIYVLYRFDMDVNQNPNSTTGGVPSNASTVTLDNSVDSSQFLPTGGDLVLVTDNTTADLYETSAAAGTTLTFGGGYNYNAGHSKSYSPPVTVAKARYVRYYVDSITDPAHPTLMVDRMGGVASQPVADDIEDMQFEYGLDTSTPANGVVDIWIPNPTFTQLAQVRQVRLRLIARTRIPEAGWAETRPALGNRAAGTTPDGYRRRTYDIVIDVRNSGV